MSQTTIDLGEVERLCRTIDDRCADLAEEDRHLLDVVFALAGQAVEQSGDEVSGFDRATPKFIDVASPTITGGTFEAFQWGVGLHGYQTGGSNPI